MGDASDPTRSQALHEATEPRRGQWLLVVGFVVLAGIVAGLAYWAWAEQARSLTGQTEGTLNAVAELKAGQIAAWQAERYNNAELIRTNRLLSAAVADMNAGRDVPAVMRDVRSYLAELQRMYGYVDVALLTPDGQTLVRVPAAATHALGPRVFALVAEAQRTRRVVSSDLYLGASGAARLEMVAPVLAPAPRDPPIASVVLHIDPQRFLYPFIQHWPLPSASGETLLVERRGNRVEYLNELRHRKGTALRLSAPASDLTLPAAMAVRGRRGIVEGIDYRGVPVIGAIAPVPGTDWFVIAKVDKSEVTALILRRGWLTAGFTLLIVGMGAAGALLLWRTRERQVDAELVASESRYRSLFESMAEGVALHELIRDAAGAPVDYRILDVNPAFSTQTGLQGPVVRGRRATTAYGTPSAPFLAEYARVVDDGAPARFDAFFEPLGRHFEIAAAAQGADRFSTIFQNVTDRRAAEEELRASERKFRETVEALDEGYYSVSAEGTLLDHNPAFCQILGVREDTDLRGQRSPDFWREAADRDAYVAELLSRGYVRDYLADAQTAGGTQLAVLLSAHVVPDERGDVARIESTLVDFTMRKSAEDEVARLNGELEQRVLDRTAELDAANKELEAFAYSVSHDLRAPLRHISGFSSLLAERAGDGLDEKSRHYVETINRSVREMGVLIDDLLEFSRAGRAELKIEPIDMDAVLREALEPLRSETGDRAIEWSIAALPKVVADRTLVRQVWANLLGNAVKYTRGRTPARIEVGASDVDGEVVFSVSDNGVGFDMQYAHKLFGIFQRLHSASEFEGTGIGLANVQRIVSRLGGAVWAESEPEHGATFYFSLPKRKETRT